MNFSRILPLALLSITFSPNAMAGCPESLKTAFGAYYDSGKDEEIENARHDYYYNYAINLDSVSAAEAKKNLAIAEENTLSSKKAAHQAALAVSRDCKIEL